jgi:enoyl-CoA hydratase/carnithine racemase
MTADSSSTVLFHEPTTASCHRIGFAQLNAERSLNSLTVEMIRLLDGKLREWAADPTIAVVVLSGAGTRAFCAGADIRRLRADIQRQTAAGLLPGLDFFAEEYRLDYRIHHYPKPVLVWGSGIVMGGGIGLMVGASHRLVTETSRLAMPETKIGLFPDVGASYFLGRLPRARAHFIGMTGVALNARDALLTNLASHFVVSTDRQRLWRLLVGARWDDDPSVNMRRLDELLAPLCEAAQPLLPSSQLEAHDAVLKDLFAEDFRTTYTNIVQHATDDAWLKPAIDNLRTGSPTSAALSWALLRRLEGGSLADVFRTELTVAIRCCLHADLSEGVRALLVDKDHAPRWSPATIDDVTREWIEHFFIEPDWPTGEHPLRDL